MRFQPYFIICVERFRMIYLTNYYGGVYMFKLITNLFFIIMLFIFLSGMPLNLDLVDIDPFQPVIETPIETETPIHYTLSDQMTLDFNTSKTLTFEILASEASEPTSEFLQSITISFNNGDQTNGYTLSDFNYSLSNSSNALATDVVLNLEDFDLLSQSSYFEVVIDSSSDTNTNVIKGSFNTLLLDKTYLEGANDEVNGDFSTTIYYPSSDYTYLIPLSIRMNYPENRTRATFIALYEDGPMDLNLYPSPSVPYAPRIYIKGGVASVYLYAYDYTAFETNFQMASQAIINTLTAMPLIDAVKLYLDDQDATPYGGVDLKTTYQSSIINQLYLTYDSQNDDQLLVPFDMALANTSSDDFEGIFQALKGRGLTMPDGIYPTVPYQVQLTDTTVTDRTATLVLSNDAKTMFDGLSESQAQNALKVFLDSLTYTYTSIDGIDQIKVHLEDGTTSLYGIDFNDVLTPKTYINLYE